MLCVCLRVLQDIRNQRRYRQRRKAELVRLQQTNTALNSKTTFFNVQIDSYNQYIKTCMDNLASKGKWVAFNSLFTFLIRCSLLPVFFQNNHLWDMFCSALNVELCPILFIFGLLFTFTFLKVSHIGFLFTRQTSHMRTWLECRQKPHLLESYTAVCMVHMQDRNYISSWSFSRGRSERLHPRSLGAKGGSGHWEQPLLIWRHQKEGQNCRQQLRQLLRLTRTAWMSPKTDLGNIAFCVFSLFTCLRHISELCFRCARPEHCTVHSSLSLFSGCRRKQATTRPRRFHRNTPPLASMRRACWSR